MSKERIQELHELTARISKLDISKLSEAQLAERNTLINNIKEELTKIKEVSDKTLINYLTKVHNDSLKHEMDPTKRSPEKASKSVAGFSRAFNKLDGRKEEGVAEGFFGIDDKIKGKIQNIVSRLSDEYGMWDHKAQTFTPDGLEHLKSILKFNDKYIKYALSLTSRDFEAEGVAEGLADEFMKMAQAKGYNVRQAGTPEQERERTQQMLAQRAKERQEQERQAALADAEKLPELKAKFEEMKKLYQSLGGSNWQYADREQNLTDAERKARSMETELNRLASQIARAEKAQGVTEDIHGEYDDEAGMAKSNLHTMSRAVAGLMDTIEDNDNLPEWAQEKLAKAEMMVTSVWDYLLSQKEQGIDPKVEQGVTEGMDDSPVAGAITRRILMQRTDLLSKYGPEKVLNAIEDVADFVGDVEEIGSSDVSGWVKQVERTLSDSSGITTEAYDRLKKVFDFSNFKG